MPLSVRRDAHTAKCVPCTVIHLSLSTAEGVLLTEKQCSKGTCPGDEGTYHRGTGVWEHCEEPPLSHSILDKYGFLFLGKDCPLVLVLLAGDLLLI